VNEEHLMTVDHYTYHVIWSPEDGEHVGLCAEFPSLSWLGKTPEAALNGIRRVVAEVAAEQGISLNRLASAKLAG
jgi:predicted RNase H-like HicB family nuclease